MLRDPGRSPVEPSSCSRSFWSPLRWEEDISRASPSSRGSLSPTRTCSCEHAAPAARAAVAGPRSGQGPLCGRHEPRVRRPRLLPALATYRSDRRRGLLALERERPGLLCDAHPVRRRRDWPRCGVSVAGSPPVIVVLADLIAIAELLPEGAYLNVPDKIDVVRPGETLGPYLEDPRRQVPVHGVREMTSGWKCPGCGRC